MGLLLSILVFSVGVLEVVACVRHIQYGYLPDWAPRRHVLATGTSGLTKLRDRWRKKPSKSADFEDKTIKGGYDVSRSCDVYYAGECREPLDDNRLGDKCGSLCEENEDTSASNFVSTDVGEFNLRYQEFEEVLPREANISNYQRSVGHPDDIKRGHNCTEIERRSDSKVKQRPSCIENIVSEEGINLYGQIPGSQSSSPRKSKADISWPLFVPHTPVSRRPSTPTTAEEEGENSPYFGGEFLTEEHVRSTQRPLSVRSETYHSDKDINPVLRTNRDDSSKSVNRPLTVASRADEHAACPAEQPSDQRKHAGDVDLEVSSFFPEENGSTNDAVLSTSEEEKAIEECIKQKRRTSKTEYLPSHEEVAVMSQKELTPDATFAARKEEPIRLKPAKTTSFEEAHLETFNTDPLHAHISDSPDTDAKHSSNLSGAGEKDVLGLNITEISAVSDSSAVIGKLQLTTARAQPDDTEQDTTGSWVQQVSTNDTDSPQSDIGSKKSNKTRKRLAFHIDPESSDVDILKSQFKDTESSSKSSKQDVVNITDLNDVRPLVEITATMVVDKIIDEAVANVCNRRSAYLFNDSHQKREQFLPSDDQPSDKVTEEFITGSQVCSQPVKYEISGSPSVENRNVEIDSKNTKFLERSTRELLNSEENVQENEKPSVSVLTSVGKTKGSEDGGQKLEEARTESQPSNNLVCEESNELDRTKTDKEESADHSKRPLVLPSDTESIQERKTTSEDKVQSVENSQDNVLSSHTNKVQESVRHSEFTSDYSQSSGENTQPAMSTKVEKIETNIEESSSSEDTSSSNQPESASAQERSENKTGSIEEVQQQSSQPAPDAFWLIFSGEYTKAMSKDWHSGHFCCWQCDESLTGQRYVLRDDHPYCIKCYESVFANTCEECNRTIGIDSKDLSYKDKHWHEACFLCTKCRVSLVDKQFGSKADKIYCGNCYDAQFASRCDGCGEIFRAGTKKMEYKTRQWHEKCFCCCVCKSPIGTKSFIPREQEIYCATCYEEKFATRCVKCNKIITSGGVTYKNEPWHRECFTCTNCNTSLAGQRFTSRDEKPYCADCFGELFAKRCTSCSKPITGIGGTRFISFEDRHWHNDCFICASCKTSLVGRGFITDNDDIICPECAKQKLM